MRILALLFSLLIWDGARVDNVRAPVLTPLPGGIVAVRLVNTTSATIPSGVVSFGQVFRDGDVPAGLVAETSTGSVPSGLSVLTRYADGSVRHALVSLMAPVLTPGQSIIMTLSPGAASIGAVELPAMYDLRLTITPVDGASVTISPAPLLKEHPAPWVSNPLVTEWRVVAPVDEHLRAVFDVRARADGLVETDVTVANDLAYAVPSVERYTAVISQGDKVLWQSAQLTHRKFQIWHHLVSPPAPVVQADPTYLISTGALLSYDLSTGVDPGYIAVTASGLTDVRIAPLGPGLYTKDMGTTGWRDDLGEMTNWEANCLVSQDPTACRIMLTQADQAGSIPWHAVDADGIPLRVTQHALLWLDTDDRCEPGSANCLPGGYGRVIAPTGWQPEANHDPDVASLAYIVTARRYYLDQVQAEADWQVFQANPGARVGGQGLLYPNNQVRGVAWGLRDLGNAAYLTPDADPLKEYFTGLLARNVRALVAAERQEPAVGEICCFLFSPYDTEMGSPTPLVAPYQQDFLVLSLAQIHGRGYGFGSDALLDWLAPFAAGRFLHGADGFDPLNGPAYWLAYAPPASPDKPVTSWGELYRLNVQQGSPSSTNGTEAGTFLPLKTLDGDPARNDGYAAGARAMAAAGYAATHNALYLRAYQYIGGQSPMMQASFATGQSQDIVLP